MPGGSPHTGESLLRDAAKSERGDFTEWGISEESGGVGR